MSEVEGTSPAVRRAPKTAFNIYAALMIVSFVALATVVTVMWVMNVKLTGQGNPFTILK